MVLREIKRFLVVSFTYTLVYFTAVLISIFLYFWTAYRWFKGSSGLFSAQRRELPPSCLNDSECGEHCYIQVKNIKLHYVEKGDKSKPLMLFVHGFPDFWYSWRYQMKHFSKQYWTVAVDLRGFGDSEKPTGVNQYKLRYLANDMKNLIEALGRKNCILVAHDWGAIIGWYFLLKYPDMVERYVMLNVPPLFSRKLKWIQMFYSWYIYFFQLPYLPELYLCLKDYTIFDQLFRNSSSSDKEAYKFTFGKPGALTYGLNLYRANLLSLLYSIKEKPESTELPKGLLIYTDNDRYVHVSNFMDAKNSVENLQTSFIKHGSHFLHQRKHEDVHKVISKFLGIDTKNMDDPEQTKSVQHDGLAS